MQRPAPPHLLRIAHLGLLAGGALFVVVYVVVALARITHPFELEWMEGVMLTHVARVRAGLPLFTAPSMEYVPLIYAPLYYHVAAAVSVVTGLSFVALRLVSFIASLGVFVLMYRVVQHETGEWRAGVTGVSMFAATFVIGGSWFDVGRNDSLFLFFSISAAYAIGSSDSVRSAVGAAFLFALAGMTKQSAVVIAAPLAFYLLVTNWRRGLAFVIPFAVLLLGLTGVLDWSSDGWYRYYAFVLPSGHALVSERILGFWTADLLRKLPVATIGGLAYAAFLVRSKDRRAGYLLAFGGGLIAAAWSSRMHSGGIENVLIPAYFAFSMFLALGLSRALRECQASIGASYMPHVLLFLTGLQFLMLVYDPRTHIPTASDRAAGRELVEVLAAIPGPVWVPGQPYLAEMAGKPLYAHAVALQDVLRAGDSGTKTALAEDLVASIEQQRFAALLLDGSFSHECAPRAPIIDDVNWICQEIQAAYRYERLLVADPNTFRPVAGSPRRPVRLYRPY